MFLRSHSSSGMIALICLPALMMITSTASDVPETNRFSMEVVKAVQPRDQSQRDLSRRSEDDITVQVGSQWFLPVQIGNPPQSFLMTPDSGAPSLAVKSVFLPQNESGNSPAYDPSKSSTAVKLDGYTYSNCFGSGHCGHGIVYNDTVTVGGVSVSMAFEVSTDNNGVSGGSDLNSGNFGLNFAQEGMTTSPQKVPTWLQTVLPLCTNKLFTMDYNETSSTGIINFGFIDTNRYRGNIGYTPVQNTGGQWTIIFSGFQVGSTGSFNNTQNWTAIVDSGTGTSALPRFVVDGYFKNIPGAIYNSGLTTYKFPCSTTLPDFVFGIDGDESYRGSIPLQGTKTGDGSCTTKLSVGNGTVIFGQDFIESQFVVFDYGGARVGFANQGASNATATGGSAQTTTSAGHPTKSSDAMKMFTPREGRLIVVFTALTALLVLFVDF